MANDELTKVTAEDRESGVEDEFGALYSPDGLRLLAGAEDKDFQIRPRTKVICDKAFEGFLDMSSITIPDSVTHIGDEAFSSCTLLSSITIPDSVTHIGHWAFNQCENLFAITIPASVTHIGPSPFIDSGIRKIKCESPLFEVDDYALYSKGKKAILSFFNSDVSEFTIPDSVTHIGDEAFNCCFGLSAITIPDSVTSIGDKAFRQCRNLSSITIPDSVTHIGDEAFSSCTLLSSITIPDSVTHIGHWAFNQCENLFAITIPASVTHIGPSPFIDSGIRKIKCESPLFEVDDYALYSKGKKAILAFFNSDASEFTIPDSVTHIGDKAFYECDGLTAITIPDSVTHIGESAFRRCRNLSSITIPDSVTHIDELAFEGCYKLDSITIPDSVTHIGDWALDVDDTTSIIIPQGSRAKFEQLLPEYLHDMLVEQLMNIESNKPETILKADETSPSYELNPDKYLDQFLALEEAAKNEIIELLKNNPAGRYIDYARVWNDEDLDDEAEASLSGTVDALTGDCDAIDILGVGLNSKDHLVLHAQLYVNGDCIEYNDDEWFEPDEHTHCYCELYRYVVENLNYATPEPMG